MLHLIRRDAQIETPWKNGGGVTCEIASDGETPPLWRVSLATIERDGPFSDFSGYDRTIVPVDGNGFDLQFDDGENVRLDAPFTVFRFAGERAVTCSLIAGASRDLNAMTQRETYDHNVRMYALSDEPVSIDPGNVVVLYAAGDARVTIGIVVAALHDGDALVYVGEGALAATALSPGALAVATAITPRA